MAEVKVSTGASGVEGISNESGRRELLALASRIFARVVQAVLLILAVIVLNFFLIHLAPGDPVSYFVPETGVSASYVQHVRHLLGLDQPLHLQLFAYVSGVVHLDLGRSLQYGEPVLPLIISRIPATLLLAGSGFVLSGVLGVLMGVAARRPQSRWDFIGTTLALAGYSVPAFWLGQILLLVFALDLGWFPADGMVSLSVQDQGALAQFIDGAHHLVLPLIAYTVFPLTLVFRLTRSKMRDTMSMDFITTARAKGLREQRVVYRHALPNAFLPVLTVIGFNFAFLLAGAVLVETVFNWPGMGRLLSTAILARDYSLILGIFTVTAVMVILANTITDILYGVLDPRISESGPNR